MNEPNHMGSRHCSKCKNTKVATHARFCELCGSKITFTCFDCDREIPEAYPYCPWAGLKMKWRN